MDYDRIFRSAIERLHDEGRYRVFIDILRTKGSFPDARCFAGHNGPKPITVWCSNDYLGMGQHPAVVEAMETALHDVGAGWLMSELSHSPFVVAAVQSATTLPVFLFALGGLFVLVTLYLPNGILGILSPRLGRSRPPPAAVTDPVPQAAE